MTKTNTAALTKSALDLLRHAGITAWRNNAIPAPVKAKDGKIIYRKFAGLKGVPDIIGFVKRHPLFVNADGGELVGVEIVENATFAEFIGVEIKVGYDKLSPAQLEFKRKLEDAGGWFFEVRDNTRGLEQFLRDKGLLRFPAGEIAAKAFGG